MRILGYNYTVEMSDDRRKVAGNLGTCDLENQAIYLSKKNSVSGIQSTLIHEIIEALNFHMELKLRHHQISSLEAGLFQVLSDNGVDLEKLLKDNLQKESSEDDG